MGGHFFRKEEVNIMAGIHETVAKAVPQIERGTEAPRGAPNPHPAGSAAATWWARGNAGVTTASTPGTKEGA